MTATEALRAFAGLDPSQLTDDMLDALAKALSTDDCDAAARARGHRIRGRALLLRGRITEARAELQRARSLAGHDHAIAAEVWADLGVIHHQLREMDEAREHYETALALGDDPIGRGRTIGNLGALEHDLRRFDAAVERYEEAIAIFRAMGHERLEGTFLANLAVLLQEMGASQRARATYILALEKLDQRDVRLEAITRSNLGLLHHELGSLDEARECHEQALALFGRVTDTRSEGLCLGRLAMVHAAMGHPDEARARCERAERLLRACGDRVSLQVLELFRAYVDVAASTDPALTRERLARARCLAAHNDDARTTVRMIEASLARDGSEPRVLVVGSEARWLTPPGGKTLDLGSRHVLRRLLWRLVEKHRVFPGEGLTLDELREAGWPGDRVALLESQNRVHVALTELRRRGLRTCLQRQGGRYMIDPGLRVEVQ